MNNLTICSFLGLCKVVVFINYIFRVQEGLPVSTPALHQIWTSLCSAGFNVRSAMTPETHSTFYYYKHFSLLFESHASHSHSPDRGLPLSGLPLLFRLLCIASSGSISHHLLLWYPGFSSLLILASVVA